jgi:outer membrane protein TolC
MKISAVTLLLALAAPLCAQEFSTAAMRPINMGETYRLALARSEAFAQQAEGIKQLEAAERGIKATFYPSFTLNMSQYKQQDTMSLSKWYVYGNYYVFNGMRDYINAKAAAARTGAANMDLERAKQQLYLNSASAYLGLYLAQQQVAIHREEVDVTTRRIKELQSRADIGRSRNSEVVAAQSQLAQDKAGYLSALSAERQAQETLKFATGLDTDLAPAEMKLTRETELEEYLKLAALRPDIAARRKSAQAYDYLAELQAHTVWPTLQVYGDYYAVRRPMPSPPYRWDGTILLSLPLFTGGAAQAGVDAAQAAKRAAELALQQAERQALSDVRAAYDEHRYAILQTGTLAEALALAAENFRYQEDDYKLGLVTNLDVLSAMNTLLQTKLSLAQARAEQDLSLIKLDTAAGLDIKQ